MVSMHWRHNDDTLIGSLGINIIEEEFDGGIFKATMPVDNRTCQNYGILNGGASIALAETLSGFASYRHCDESHVPCGIQVSANHLNMARFGATVTALARPAKLGRNMHVWDVEIRDENGLIISKISVTNMIIEKKFY